MTPGLKLWLLLLMLAGCAAKPPAPVISPAVAGATIGRSLPAGLADRAGWAADLKSVFTALKIAPTTDNVCAVLAVTEQESNFQVDPVVPNLGTIAWAEIDKRAARLNLPPAVLRTVLDLKSSTGNTYAERIDSARTEKQLSDIFEDFTGTVPLGRSMFSSWNPIRTRGPMQVGVEFAERYAAAHPYPYPIGTSIADELFTRRGSLYFGTAHLLAYPADYPRFLYRFADYNAGQYASRNAAFQRALSAVQKLPVVADGALLPHGAGTDAGGTELAARALGERLRLTDAEIHAALEEGRAPEFERTALYREVFALADRTAGSALPRASVPHIELKGPKIERKLTTDWYAQRVEQRFERCLKRPS
jgi:hypothetical protein